MILAVLLIMRCTPTIHELIVLTLPPRHRCPLDRLPASRLLLPRSGLERSDFVRWHQTDLRKQPGNVRYSGMNGSSSDALRGPSLCFVQVFGRRHEEAIHALRRPASEKRQCTKSREVGHRISSGRYEDLMQASLVGIP